MMQIRIPPQIPPDRTIIVQTPTGQRISVKVPPNVVPGQMIQVQVPVSSQPTQEIEVAVPAFCVPGQQIRVRAPGGLIEVMIPDGVGPGMKFRVRVPAHLTTPRPPTPAAASQQGGAVESATGDNEAAEDRSIWLPSTFFYV